MGWRFVLKAVDPPGPTGAANGRINARFFRSDVFTFLSNLTQVYGDIVRFDIGHTACVLVNGASAVDRLLHTCEPFLHKPDFVSASNRGHWGDGLTTLEGADWQDRRRLLRPQFRPREITPRLDIVAECTADMIRNWRAEPPVDLMTDIRLLTARIAARTVMDVDIEGWGNPDGCTSLLPYDEIFGEDFTASEPDDADGILRMERPRAPRDLPVITDLIKRRLDSDCDGRDVLSVLIRTCRAAGVPPDYDMITGEIVQMLYAGHLTMPTSLGALWSCMAQDAQTGQQIAEEADRLEVGTAPPALPELGRSLALAALKEALRMHPPAPLLYRIAAQSFELEGFAVTAGHHVWVSPCLLHRDPRYFEDPDQFQPARFAFGRPQNVPRSVYLPFGAGPRTCIAMHQAFNQMTLIILMVAQHFELRSSAGSLAHVTLIARGGSP